MVQGFRFARVSGQRIDWLLPRHWPVSPARLAGAYGVLSAGVLLIASLVWVPSGREFGWVVTLETALAVVGFVFYGRHAADREQISLQGSRLVVELETAGKLERAEFDRRRVHVEPKTGDQSLITLSAQGRTVEVGRFVRPELRSVLASEIRAALRAA